MSKNSTANSVIPDEYRKISEKLFPKNGFSMTHKPDLKAAAEFAKALGVGAEYQRVMSLDKKSSELQTFLHHFRINLDLLIKKTWVEQHEQRRKDSLHDEIPSLVEKLDKGDYAGGIKDFGKILEELAYLFFGEQSRKEDFTEYTFRIDIQMGLFWWYSSMLSSLDILIEKNNGKEDKFLWAVILLGICYLTNF